MLDQKNDAASGPDFPDVHEAFEPAVRLRSRICGRRERALAQAVGRLNRKTIDMVCEAVRESNCGRVTLALDFLQGLPDDGKKMVVEITENYRIVAPDLPVPAGSTHRPPRSRHYRSGSSQSWWQQQLSP